MSRAGALLLCVAAVRLRNQLSEKEKALADYQWYLYCRQGLETRAGKRLQLYSYQWKCMCGHVIADL